MQVCVCGWYYYPELYRFLNSVKCRFDIVVIKNRPGDTLGIRSVSRQNTGLDWGAFSYFLDSEWDAKSDVLFLQDDIKVTDRLFDEVEKITHDQAFIFENESQFRKEYSHGRAFFASAKFLNELKKKGGIWYDKGNKGFIAKGYSWSEEPPKGSMHHNAGIRAFTAIINEIGKEHKNLKVDKQIYSSNIVLGKRGKFEKWA